MPDVKIVDRYGQPIRQETLTEEMASPSLIGVRQSWLLSSVASSLTPSRLSALIQGANAGNDYDYLTLAEEMEERELHYGSVLSTRKLAVEGLDIGIEAAGDDTASQEIAQAVRNQVERAEFGDLISDLLDGLGKGRSTVEIIWHTGKQWYPAEFIWRDPRYFQFHPERATELRLRDESDMVNGIELAPYKFITHSPKLRTGLPVRRGLARTVSVSYMLKSFTLRDWMAGSELTGLPIRVGRYGTNATEGEKQVLRRALANLGSDAAAMIPESMRIEFVERASTGSWHALFKDLADYMDKGISKAVLGQTATTEGTPGKLGNSDEQADVREDLLRADAKQLSNTLQRQFVEPFVNINYGAQDKYPRIKVFIPDSDDIDALVANITRLMPFGLKVSQAYLLGKMGVPEPQPDEAVLEGNPSPPTPLPQGGKGVNSQHHGGCQCGGCQGVALNSQTNTRDGLDDFIDEELADWQPVMESVLDDLGILQLQQLVPDMSPEELRAEISRRMQNMNGMEKLVNALALASFKARVDGYVQG